MLDYLYKQTEREYIKTKTEVIENDSDEDKFDFSIPDEHKEFTDNIDKCRLSRVQNGVWFIKCKRYYQTDRKIGCY